MWVVTFIEIWGLRKHKKESKTFNWLRAIIFRNIKSNMTYSFLSTKPTIYESQLPESQDISETYARYRVRKRALILLEDRGYIQGRVRLYSRKSAVIFPDKHGWKISEECDNIPRRSYSFNWKYRTLFVHKNNILPIHCSFLCPTKYQKHMPTSSGILGTGWRRWHL